VPPLAALAACEALDSMPAERMGFAIATLLRDRTASPRRIATPPA